MLLLIKYFFKVLLGLSSELEIKKLIAKSSSLLKLYLELWGEVIKVLSKFIVGNFPSYMVLEEKELLTYLILLNKKLSSNNSLLVYLLL